MNAYRLSFWILSYILCDKNLLEAIRAEIKSAFMGDTVDNRHVYEDCSRSAAPLEETLRLTFGSVSVRKVAKLLGPGNPVMIPIRQFTITKALSDPVQANWTRKNPQGAKLKGKHEL